MHHVATKCACLWNDQWMLLAATLAERQKRVPDGFVNANNLLRKDDVMVAAGDIEKGTCKMMRELDMMMDGLAQLSKLHSWEAVDHSRQQTEDNPR